MYRQWAQAKRDYPDALILFRVGDFYEMFGEDAEVGARELQLTLTSRQMGNKGRIAMCGVPHHAIDRYLKTLIQKGHRAAICEQVEDPKKIKGLVRRQVTRVVTAGTLLEDDLIGNTGHNFLVSLAKIGKEFGIAAVDASTGDFLVTQINPRAGEVTATNNILSELAHFPTDSTLVAAVEEVVRLQPAELLLNEELDDDEILRTFIHERVGVPISIPQAEPDFTSPREQLQHHFGVSSLEGFGCDDKPAAIVAAAQALAYLKHAHLESMPRLSGITTYSTDQFMVIDASTRRNLELVSSLRDQGRQGTLLQLLDHTYTPMGARLLRAALLQPLLDLHAIEARLQAVEELFLSTILSDQIRQRLRGIYDLERLAARATAGTANARDLRALSLSLLQLPTINDELNHTSAELLGDIRHRIDPLPELTSLLENAIVDEPPVQITEGHIIREGYDAQLAQLRTGASDGRQWIANLQDSERARTGIKSLKVGFNKVFGYYIEVSKANLDLVPVDYERKQTLVNAERYVTPELKKQEAHVLGSDERSHEMEYEIFVRVRERVAQERERILSSARAIAELDMLVSLALAAMQNNYTRPELNNSDQLLITDGRHPVVERALVDDLFVPNDAQLDCQQRQLLIVTGPNMAGKSTYLRQVALIALMAQMGSFVPARAATIGVLDRIFTRVGASDDLATGQSTFMVEMTEAANILHNATDRSLVILDELGRGTSTYDGMSLAWAVAEYMVKHIGAKTLFATHYHHLNELETLLPGVRNLRVTVKEQGDEIVFLHKIVAGGTDRSYGIQVARLAGLPDEVVERAREVLHTLEGQDLAVGPSSETVRQIAAPVQMQLFEGVRDPVVQKLMELDLELLSPIEALVQLKKLQDEATGKG
jgi:DNA mismatch repair protein MutS